MATPSGASLQQLLIYHTDNNDDFFQTTCDVTMKRNLIKIPNVKTVNQSQDVLIQTHNALDFFYFILWQLMRIFVFPEWWKCLQKQEKEKKEKVGGPGRPRYRHQKTTSSFVQYQTLHRREPNFLNLRRPTAFWRAEKLCTPTLEWSLMSVTASVRLPFRFRSKCGDLKRNWYKNICLKKKKKSKGTNHRKAA